MILDRQESAWLDKQLNHVKSEVYNYEYPDVKHRSLIPVDNSADEADTSVTYHIYNKVGMFQIISNQGQDLPRVDEFAQEFTAKVKNLGGSFGYTFADIRAAKKTGRSLSQSKAKIAKESHLQAESRLAWFGDAKHNIQGLFEHPNAIRVTLPPDGSNGGTSFGSKEGDPRKLARDLNTLANASIETTNGLCTPDTLLLTIRDYRTLRTVQYNESKTLLSYFKEANPHIRDIVALPELKGGSSTGHDLAICYKRDPSCLSLNVPMDFTQHSEQQVNLEVVVPCEASCAGVILIKPLSVAYCVLKDSTSSPSGGPSLETNSFRSNNSNSLDLESEIETLRRAIISKDNEIEALKKASEDGDEENSESEPSRRKRKPKND